MNELYHYGVKGMKWGVRKEKFKQTVNKTMGGFLGLENKYVNKALRSTGKLRKAYFNAQMQGVKVNKQGQYKYTSKNNRELYLKQRAAARKAQRYADEFLKKYGNKPLSYLESMNAQKGAAAGTALGIAVPIVLPLWATIPAGYYIGSRIGGKSVKHSDDLMHYGVKGMKWDQHIFGDDELSTRNVRSGNSDDNQMKRKQMVSMVKDINRRAGYNSTSNGSSNGGDWWANLGNALQNASTSISNEADRLEQVRDLMETRCTEMLNDGNAVGALAYVAATYENDDNFRRFVNVQIETLADDIVKDVRNSNSRNPFANIGAEIFRNGIYRATSGVENLIERQRNRGHGGSGSRG